MSTVDAAIVYEFTALSGGSFGYGCRPGQPFDFPLHTILVAPFELGRLPVTVDDYQACVADGTCEPPHNAEPHAGAPMPECNWGVQGKGAHPVNCVSWKQAGRFCKWLGARLPTSEEREWAAKSGEDRLYPWGDDPPDPMRARFGLPYADGTGPADELPAGASKQGVLGLAGNVWDWTSTSRAAGQQDIMGGSWYHIPTDLQACNRFFATAPDYAEPGIGFRCARP